MQKKASLSLSVNAIVILILAIVMLGLGLSFIRGMFGKVTKQLEQQIANEPEPGTPTGSNPITLSRENIVTRAGEREIIKVGLYNPTDGQWLKTYPTISCNDIPDISSTSNEKTIGPGKLRIFNLLLKIPSRQPDMYLCTIGINGAAGYEKDIALKIVE